VEPNASLRSSIRNILMQLGFNNIDNAPDYRKAISKLNDNNYSHMIFDVYYQDLSPKEFLQQALCISPSIISIPTSDGPTADTVFDLLIAGARSFVVKPYTVDTLNDSISFASKTDSIANYIGNAKNRDEALVRIVLTSLNRLAVVLKQSKRFHTAKKEVPRRARTFRHSLEIAKMFCTGDELDFRDLMVDMLADRAPDSVIYADTAPKRVRKRKRDKKLASIESEQIEETED
jgi:two-component system chemotaxis response regulator CheY